MYTTPFSSNNASRWFPRRSLRFTKPPTANTALGYLPAVRSRVPTASSGWAEQLSSSECTKFCSGFGANWSQRQEMEPRKLLKTWWPGTELNRRRQPFQGCALPPELPGHARAHSLAADCRASRMGHASTIAELPANTGQSKRWERVEQPRLSQCGW